MTTSPAKADRNPTTSKASATSRIDARLERIFDRKPDKAAREEWAGARRAERQYATQLRKIARHIAELTLGQDPQTEAEANELATTLQRYAETLTPWARTRARRMVAEIKARSDRQWKAVGVRISEGLQAEFASPMIGARISELMAEQVRLIRSIPLDAAERVHKLVSEAALKGERFPSIAREIQRAGEVSKSKANLIARTESGRVQTVLTQARAESVGSKGYIWRTARDSDVRDSHRKMEGKFVAWDDPPTLDNLTGHAGAVPNCRCYCEPVIPEI